jgi:hypothetical protein
MTEIAYYNNGVENQFIDKLIKQLNSKIIFYKPYAIDKETLCVNVILRKILSEKHFEWCDPKSYTNSFGKALYYNNNKFNFEKIPIDRSKILRTSGIFSINIRHLEICINQIPNNIFSYKNIAIINTWIVIDNPKNLKLNDIVDNIRLEYGGLLYQKYCTTDIESEINILAYIFHVDGIKYKNNKIYIPLMISFNNTLILNNTYHTLNILLGSKNRTNIDFEIYGNICDTNIFPQLSKTNNINHDCQFTFYQTQFTGEDSLSMMTNKIILNFNHPTYVLYIMNISKKYINSIKLFIDTIDIPDDIEYKLNDIEWFDNHAIIWLNRNFLLLNELNNGINFSRCNKAYLIIENTYSENNPIQLIAVNFQMLYHTIGMTGFQFIG